MANKEHLEQLKQGVEAWNQWRWENPKIKPNLSGTDLSNANLSRADLSNASLSRAILWIPNVTNNTNPSHSVLFNAFFRYSNLSGANLSGANLSGADLSCTDLSGADLSTAQALHTNFNRATLTGACIKDWNINFHTNLQDVICEYIFTGYDTENLQFTDRRPHDPNQIFAPSEFTKRYQIVLETVDLFFSDGIDWKAFLTSLNDLQAQYGNDLSVQGIEKKAGGTFLVRLEVPSDVDKGMIERAAKDLYETKLQTLEAYYEERLQLRGEQLDFFKEQVEIERIRNTRLEKIVETMAEKESAKYDLRGSKFGGGFAAEEGTQTGGTFDD